MKAPFSPWLDSLRDSLKQLLALLRPSYDYVSVLASDSRGLNVSISQRARTVGSETISTERGIVVRVGRDGLYSEYALNRYAPGQEAETAEEAQRPTRRRRCPTNR